MRDFNLLNLVIIISLLLSTLSPGRADAAPVAARAAAVNRELGQTEPIAAVPPTDEDLSSTALPDQSAATVSLETYGHLPLSFVPNRRQIAGEALYYAHTGRGEITVVDAPITGLTAANDSPTIQGRSTNLAAGVTTGSNVAYTWDFGDGTAGNGAVVTRTYPAENIYAAVVTASNSVSVLTATTLVTITTPTVTVKATHPIGNGQIVAQNEVVSATFSHNIAGSTVNTRTFTVYGEQTGIYEGGYTISGDSVEFDTADEFKPGEKIVVNLSNGIEAPDGAVLKPYAWQFGVDVGDSDAVFVDSGQQLSNSQSLDVVLGDVDNDGDLDAFIGMDGANQVWLNDGTGVFTNSGQSLGGSGTRVALGDLDSDGDLDAFFANGTSGGPNANQVWLNDGLGVFTDSGQSLGNLRSWNVDLGDLDGDGDLDAFVGNGDYQPNKVWLNNGNGVFIDSGQVLGNVTSYQVALGDLDGDGDLDAFVGNGDYQPNTVWLNDGGGFFSSSGQNIGSLTTTALDLGDIDGDGDLDAFLGNSWGQTNQIWLNNGDGFFTNNGQILGTVYVSASAFGDLDGDGDLDLFMASEVGSKVWLNNGAGYFLDSGQNIGNLWSVTAALGDLDADLDLDAFVGNATLSAGDQFDQVFFNQAQPQLVITKTAPGFVTAGDLITYTLTVTNRGHMTATNLIISDTIPAGAYYVGGGTKTGNVVTWMVPSLPVSSAVETSFVVTASSTITNILYSVSSDEGVSATGSKAKTTLVFVPIEDLSIASDSLVEKGQVTTLTATVASGNDVSYLWNFGNGAIENGRVVTYTYPAAGTYTVVVTASNKVSVVTVTTVLTVFNAAVSDFSAQPRIGSAPLVVTFTNNSQFSDNYLWNYGDRFTSTTSTVTHAHVYITPGIYTVTLTGSNTFGENTTTRPGYITVHTPSLSATIYYVDAENGDDILGDGSQNAPWKTITYALSQVPGPDMEIRVASGVYDGALGESFPLIMNPGVKLIGSGYNTTVISGDGSNYVIHFPGTSVYTDSTVVSGFKATGGSEGVRVDSPAGSVGSSPSIQENWITGNTYGVHSRTSFQQRVHTIIKNNLITNNSGYGVYNYASYSGSYANLNISGNQIIDNGDAGIYCYAQGSSSNVSHCSSVISNNLIAGNTGDGVNCYSYYAGNCSMELTGNTIANNQGWGLKHTHTGTYLVTSASRLANNLIYGNNNGGTLFIYVSGSMTDLPLLVNNTIVNNNAYGVRSGLPTIVNSIIWGHTDDLDVSTDQVSYSDVGEAGYDSVNNNVSVDPLFVDPGNDNYHLSPLSPIINSGDSSHPDLPLIDIDGDSRILGSAVDIGADESYGGLVVTKTANPNALQPGESLTYTIRITNTGRIDLHTLITDTLPEHISPTGVLTWTPTITADGGVWTQQLAVTVMPDFHGVLTNAVTVVTNEGAKGDSFATITVDKAIIGLVAINDSPTVFNQTTRLTATITTGSDVTYTWDFGDGDIGGGGEVSHIYPMVGVYTTIVTATNSINTLTTTTVITITGMPDLSIAKTVAPPSAAPGEIITYTLTFSNAGDGIAGGVVITDYIPINVTVQNVISSGTVAITRTGSSQSAEVFETSAVSFGQGGVITITALVSDSLAAGVFTNTAEITGTGDTTFTNNRASAGVTVLARPTLQAIQPPRNAITASLTTPITAVYDQPMDASTVTSVTFAVHGMQSGLVTETHGVINGSTLVVTPASPFHQGELVYAIATTRTTNITGTSPLNGTQWQFNAGEVKDRCVGGFTEVYAGDLTDVGGSGAAWGDYNNDGKLDILLTGYTDTDPAAKIYRNTGSGFVEVYADSLTNVFYSNVAWGDYDNDGDLDILLTGVSDSGLIAKIYQNKGNGFSEVYTGSLPGIYLGDVAWGDYDNDGDLDVLLTGGDITEVYQNTGDNFNGVATGSLKDVGGGSAAWGDYDNDGDLDILLTGGDGSSLIAKIYQNMGGGFNEVYTSSLVGVDSSSVAWGDYDNDGDLDILFTGKDNSNNPVAKVYQNTGSGFSEVYAGSLTGVMYGSVAWGDYDNDGDLDILLTGDDGSIPANTNPIAKIYQNTGSGFSEVYPDSLTGVYNSSVTWGDYDNDGDLDILLTGLNNTVVYSKIYRNDDCADLSLSKTVAPPSAAPGETLTYTLTFSNAGDGIAGGVIITDYIPISVTVQNVISSGTVAITRTGSSRSAEVFETSAVSFGQGGVITITALVSDSLAAGVFTNTAEITGTGDTTSTNNRASAGVTVVVPQITVSGNGQIIPNGDATPSPTDDTDFGQAQVEGETVTHTFIISNSGQGDLTLTASPRVTVSGSHAGDYSVTAQPGSPINANSRETFILEFDPIAAGQRTAVISIANNDANKNPYTYTVQGTGIYPSLSISDAGVVEGDVGAAKTVFTVTLSAAGGAPVTVTAQTQADTATAGSDYVAAASDVSFAAGDTTAPFTVTVKGDYLDEGAGETFTVTLSSPQNATIDDGSGVGTIIDDDSAGINVISLTSPITISEPSGSGQFTLTLTSEPTATVTIFLSNGGSDECVLSTGLVSLNSGNWASGVGITVTARDDSVADGTQPCPITTQPAISSDPNYHGLNPPDVTVNVLDDELPLPAPVAGFEMTLSGPTSEYGDTAIYRIRLTGEPTGTVTVSVISTDTTEGVLTPGLTLTFNSGNWDSYQDVVVTGVDDLVQDGDQVYTVRAVGAGGGYDGVVSETAVTNLDNDNVDLALNKTAEYITLPDRSLRITYTLTVSNADSNRATGVVVSDTLPGGVSYVNSSASNGSSYNPAMGVWDVGVVYSTPTVVLTLVVTAPKLSAGVTITNTAVISQAGQGDPVPGNNSKSAAVSGSTSGSNVYLPVIVKAF